MLYVAVMKLSWKRANIIYCLLVCNIVHTPFTNKHQIHTSLRMARTKQTYRKRPSSDNPPDHPTTGGKAAIPGVNIPARKSRRSRTEEEKETSKHIRRIHSLIKDVGGSRDDVQTFDRWFKQLVDVAKENADLRGRDVSKGSIRNKFANAFRKYLTRFQDDEDVLTDVFKRLHDSIRKNERDIEKFKGTNKKPKPSRKGKKSRDCEEEASNARKVCQECPAHKVLVQPHCRGQRGSKTPRRGQSQMMEM